MAELKVTLEHAAKDLALANGEAETSISRIYWFPAQNEIRLVEVDDLGIKSSHNVIEPFYFSPIPAVPYPSGIALIHPDEEGAKLLPAEWKTDWNKGEIIFDRDKR